MKLKFILFAILTLALLTTGAWAASDLEYKQTKLEALGFEWKHADLQRQIVEGQLQNLLPKVQELQKTKGALDKKIQELLPQIEKLQGEIQAIQDEEAASSEEKKE